MIALCIPYMVSFIEDGNSFFNKIDLAFAIGLGIDLIINFFIAHQDPIQGTVIDLKAISIHYLKTWFLIDFLSM